MRLALALSLALLVAACGGGSEPAGEPAPPPAAREAAPAIEGATVDGEELSLADLRGEPVLVNVWSSW